MILQGFIEVATKMLLGNEPMEKIIEYIGLDEEEIKKFKTATEGLKLIAVNYTTMRNELKNILDKVADDCETVLVTRKKEKNIVLMSLEQYNNLVENDFIFGNKKYYNRLVESKKQIEKNQQFT